MKIASVNCRVVLSLSSKRGAARAAVPVFNRIKKRRTVDGMEQSSKRKQARTEKQDGTHWERMRSGNPEREATRARGDSDTRQGEGEKGDEERKERVEKD